MSEKPTGNISIGLRKILRKMRLLLFSKDALIFLFFLMLSAIFWFVHSLDQQRETSLRIPIDYMGIPEDVEIEGRLPRHIEVTVRDEGYTILKYNNRTTVPLALDMERIYFAKGKIIITSDQLKNRVSRYVLPTTAVLSIKPDSIVVSYNKLITKTLPIRLAGEVKLTPQYALSDSIQIEPAAVKVFGPRHVLDTMTAVYTETFQHKAISDSIVLKMKLNKPPKGVRYAFNEVDVAVFAEMFTENKIELPITIFNAPDNVNIRLFPHVVTLTYNVGLSNYKRVNANDFQVVFDYNDAKDLEKRRYTLQVVNNSKYTSGLRVQPEQVEFLLEEK